MSDLNNLHTAISEHFNVGTLEEFSAKMQTPEARKNFYDAVTAQNINLGDYDDYENRLKQPDFEDELDEETQVDEVETDEDIVTDDIASKPDEPKIKTGIDRKAKFSLSELVDLKDDKFVKEFNVLGWK